MRLGGVLVAAAWLGVQVSLFWLGGIRQGGDTPRYLGAAEGLLRGEWPAGKATGYLGYDLFVALFLGTGLGTAGVVAAQVALSGLAVYCLYRLAARLYDRRVGMLAALLSAVYPAVQTWNFYVLTESSFVSLAIVSAWLWTGAGTPGARAAAGAVLLFASLVRPHGVVLLLAALAWVAWSLGQARRYALLAAVVAATALAVPGGAAVLGSQARHEQIVEHYARGTIIWGYAPLALPLPGPLPARVAAEPNPGLQIVAVAAAYPAYFLRLFGWKVGYEYVQARPYYSALHNGLLLATLLPAYALAGWGVSRRAADPAAKAFLVAVVVGQTGLIGLTFADWDGRHLLVILPVVFLFAAAGAVDLAARWAGR